MRGVPSWLQREMQDALEGHVNAYEVSLLCKEAEESALHGGYDVAGRGGGGGGIGGGGIGGGGGSAEYGIGSADEDDTERQTPDQYLQVL